MFRVISSLLPVSNLIFGKKSQKIAKKSQKINLNRIIRQRIVRFLKFEFFGSIVDVLDNLNDTWNT